MSKFTNIAAATLTGAASLFGVVRVDDRRFTGVFHREG
jgi:hypothetical protein